jgi:hypothetical protein
MVVARPCGSVSVIRRRSSIDAARGALMGRSPTEYVRMAPLVLLSTRICVPAGRAPAGAVMVTLPLTGYEKTRASRFHGALASSRVVKVTAGTATALPNVSFRPAASNV